MEAPERSAVLLQRGAELRAQSVRMLAAAAERRAAAADRVEKKRRWLAAGHSGPVPVDAEALVQISQEARARAQATREQIRRGQSR